MLNTAKCCLVIVDIQGKLAELMDNKEAVFANIEILIKAAKILDFPILWCKQHPQALGPTIPQIAGHLGDKEPIDKFSFSCCGHDQFNEKLEGTGGKAGYTVRYRSTRLHLPDGNRPFE